MANRDTYVASIKSAFVTMGNRVVMSFLATQFPFLLSPFIKPIVEWAVNMVIETLVDNVEMQAFFMYIDTRVDQQGREFSAAALENLEAQKNGTPEQKLLARNNLISKFKSFAMLKS